MTSLFNAMNAGMYFQCMKANLKVKIKDSLETSDNPFEDNESIFLSTDSRATQRRKGKKYILF